ncbi:MAG: hypothetical protein QOH61_2521 [Chloroflexota bacterium]|jgi:deazaflavin-dependent oxidoreductase (nitroreductase family)|nr:hypothetical protein [Chloroflexota bacterium]
MTDAAGSALPIPPGAADQAYVWLTATGRRSGLERTVELWFGLVGSTLYLLAGGGRSAGWVQNSLATEEVRVRMAGATYRGGARVVEPGTDEEQAARRLLAAKYQGWSEGRPLSGWARNSLCIALDLTGEVAAVEVEPAAG